MSSTHEHWPDRSAPAIVGRTGPLREMRLSQIAVSTHDRASPDTLELFATEVLPARLGQRG